MRKKLSKRFKKLIEVPKDKKTLIIDDAISKVKIIVLPNSMSL